MDLPGRGSMTWVELPEAAGEARSVGGRERLRWLPEGSVTAALLPPLRNLPAGEPQVLPNEGNLRAGIGRTGANADADSTVGAVGECRCVQIRQSAHDRKHEGSPWACSGLKTRCSLTNSTCSPLRVRASTSDRSVGAKSLRLGPDCTPTHQRGHHLRAGCRPRGCSHW